MKTNLYDMAEELIRMHHYVNSLEMSVDNLQNAYDEEHALRLELEQKLAEVQECKKEFARESTADERRLA